MPELVFIRSAGGHLDRGLEHVAQGFPGFTMTEVLRYDTTRMEDASLRPSQASILLVDDDPALRTQVAGPLEEQGYEVREAANGREALEQQRSRPADLIITDLFMPEKGGLELIAELQSPPSDQVPVFVMAEPHPGRAMNMLRMAETLGAKRTFEKPVDLSTLIQAIREELPKET